MFDSYDIIAVVCTVGGCRESPHPHWLGRRRRAKEVDRDV